MGDSGGAYYEAATSKTRACNNVGFARRWGLQPENGADPDSGLGGVGRQIFAMGLRANVARCQELAVPRVLNSAVEGPMLHMLMLIIAGRTSREL
jgi:hypothetical protein